MRDTASLSSVAAMAFRWGIETVPRWSRNNTMAWRARERQHRRDPSLAGSYTPPPNKPTSVHLSPTASSRNPKTVGMPKAPIEYAHEIKQCTFSPRVREAASFFERRVDGVKLALFPGWTPSTRLQH